MAALPFTTVTWQVSGPITNDKLNKMANNDQWLFENMPKIQYSANNIKRTAGVKMLAGQSRYPAVPKGESTGISIAFGSFFTPGCRPTVVGVIATGSSPHKKYLCISALGNAGNEVVDHRGFNAYIHATPWQGTTSWPLGNSGIVHWIALGY